MEKYPVAENSLSENLSVLILVCFISLLSLSMRRSRLSIKPNIGGPKGRALAPKPIKEDNKSEPEKQEEKEKDEITGESYMFFSEAVIWHGFTSNVNTCTTTATGHEVKIPVYVCTLISFL